MVVESHNAPCVPSQAATVFAARRWDTHPKGMPLHPFYRGGHFAPGHAPHDGLALRADPIPLTLLERGCAAQVRMLILNRAEHPF